MARAEATHPHLHRLGRHWGLRGRACTAWQAGTRFDPIPDCANVY